MTKKMLELKERIKLNAAYIKYSNLRLKDTVSETVEAKYQELRSQLVEKKPGAIYENGIKDVYIGRRIRYYHVAYSLMKGRTYSQIETKVHECNRLTKSDWEFIKKIQDQYGVPDETNVCVSA